MRFVLTLFTAAAAIYGFWWFSSTRPELRDRVEDFLHTQSFRTLEVRFTAPQIMESHRRELLKTARHKYLEPKLTFYPYLLMEIKYRHSDDETREGIVLWDLVDGEMVIDTKNWLKTHGFGDCLNADAERHEFNILNVLAKKGGSCDREGLSKALHVENETLDSWIESCRRKKLIVQTGNRYRLHMQHPNLKTYPETKIEERLVTQATQHADRISRHYSLGQIQRLAKAAFGQDFTIRRTTDLYLPVHCIIVQNPDGSIHSSHWNALNGKRLMQTYFIE
ncbi:MAG: hypothetical protein KGZ39_07960 [Simkania sp.]|nr:hypothetical protein [Simkania sp.]